MKREGDVSAVNTESITVAVQSATRGRVRGELLSVVWASQPVIGHLETLIFALMIKVSASSSVEVERTRGTWLWG